MRRFILGLVVLCLFSNSLYAGLTTAKNVRKISKQSTEKLKKKVLDNKDVKILISTFMNYVDIKVKKSAKIGYKYHTRIGLHYNENKQLNLVLINK